MLLNFNTHKNELLTKNFTFERAKSVEDFTGSKC
jgi:hypothetical protein